MIRKITHIAIASLLFILTMGFTVSSHYCGETLVDVSVLTGHLNTCSDYDSACNMDGCCHNTNDVFQLNEDYTSPQVLEHVAFFQVALAEFAIHLLHDSLLLEKSDVLIRMESPPPQKIGIVLSSLQVYRL